MNVIQCKIQMNLSPYPRPYSAVAIMKELCCQLIGGGGKNFYLNASYNNSKDNKSFTMRGMDYSIGYTFGIILNATINVNTGVSIYKIGSEGKQVNYNNKYASLNVSIPLGQSSYMSVSTNTSGKTMNNTLNLNTNFRLNQESTSHVTLNEVNNTDTGLEHYASIGIDKNNKNYYLSANAGYSNISKANGFFNLSGTQILSANGLFATNQKSDSYLVVSDATDENFVNGFINPLSSQIAISDGEKVISNEVTSSANSTIIPLPKYNQRFVKINTMSGNVFNKNKSQVEGFTLPGSVFILKTNYDKEYQVLAAFYDKQGNSVTTLQCNGESCGRIEEIGDGLYKLYFKGNTDFKITSNGEKCLNSTNLSLYLPLTKIGRVSCINQHSN